MPSADALPEAETKAGSVESGHRDFNGAGGPNTIEILQRVAAPSGSMLPFPRLIVVLAHPDDEVLAFGGRLERLRHSVLLCCTDGAPVSGIDARAHGFQTLRAYRSARRGELAAALRLAGLPESCAQPLLVASNEDEVGPVPDQQAAFHLVALTRAISQQIAQHRPEAVLTHPFEGGHPDHDSCAFAVHRAVQLAGEAAGPLILEAPFYHAGKSGIETGRFLNARDLESSCSAVTCRLSLEEQERKRERLACFRTQQQTLAQFALDREQYRIAPEYDFSRPPHPGPLFYEGFPWGVSGQRFCALAKAALTELGLPRHDGDRHA